MATRKRLDTTVMVVAVLGSLALLNVVALAFFGRLDLTRDRQFTLSRATQDTLRALHEPVTVRAYFTRDLPPPHATNARYVRDLLEEYYNRAHGQLRFEFIDPMAEESDADKEKKKDVRQDIFGRQIREATAMERELQSVGIPPVQVRVNEADKLEVKRAYMGLAVHYGDKKEVIPVVSETTGLEYDLTTLIRKLVRDNSPKIGILQGHDGPNPQTELAHVTGLLREMFDVGPMDLGNPVPEGTEAVLLVGPKTALSDTEKKNLDAYLTAGHSVGVFAGPIKPNFQTLQSEDNTPELGELLGHWGVNVGPGLIVDAECATISVAQQAGFMRINQPVKYPLLPVPRSLDDHPLTRGLAQVVFPFTAPVTVSLPEGSATKAEVLVQSSSDSWVQQPPYNLDPLQRWAPPPGELAAHPIAVALSGPIKSAYAAPEAAASEGAPAPDGRLVVVGGSDWLTDQFMGKTNEALVLNLVDWLVRDDGLLAVRSRGLAAAPLKDVGDSTRNTLKYLNVLGLPLTFVGFGLVRWRRREARRTEVTL